MSRRDPRVARIVRAWRALTTPAAARRIGPGERTLVACSAGADSSALVLALASASAELVVGHVIHDLRPEAEAVADRDRARALATSLGLAFSEARVAVRPALRSGGRDSNAEAVARRLRYHALLEMAATHGCRFVATAHHADDQLETMLMAVIRGAGPRGLAGVAPLRRLTGGGPRAGAIWVIRPMLGDATGQVRPTTRSDAEAICRMAGWEWSTDSTNADVSLLRNALRREVTPVLERLRPGAAVRAARAAPVVRDSARAVRGIAARLEMREGRRENGDLVLSRASLRREPGVVIGELLLRACRLRSGGSGGRDRLGRRTLAPVVRAIRDSCTDPREFRVGPLNVRVTASRVQVRGSPDAERGRKTVTAAGR